MPPALRLRTRSLEIERIDTSTRLLFAAAGMPRGTHYALHVQRDMEDISPEAIVAMAALPTAPTASARTRHSGLAGLRLDAICLGARVSGVLLFDERAFHGRRRTLVLWRMQATLQHGRATMDGAPANQTPLEAATNKAPRPQAVDGAPRDHEGASELIKWSGRSDELEVCVGVQAGTYRSMRMVMDTEVLVLPTVVASTLSTRARPNLHQASTVPHPTPRLAPL